MVKKLSFAFKEGLTDEFEPVTSDVSFETEGRDDDAADNPSIRILRTIECLASGGAMTLDQLSERMGVPKTAVWRSVSHLREADWVRLRKGNRLIELHYRIDELFSCATFSDEEFGDIRETLEGLSAELAIHVDIFALSHKDGIDLIDTTRRWRGDQAALMEWLDDDVLLVARSAMSESVLARHLAAWEQDDHQQNTVQFRKSDRTLPTVRWGEDTQSLNIAVRGLKGTPGALRVSGRRRKLQRQESRDLIERLRGLLCDKIEFI